MKRMNKVLLLFSVALVFSFFSFSYCNLKSEASDLWIDSKKGEVTDDFVIKGDTFAKLAAKAEPAVVYISTTKSVDMPQNFWWNYHGKNGQDNNQNPFGDLFGDDFFRKFFGGPQGGPGIPNTPGKPPKDSFKQQGLGSGFIINKDGYIVTNWHVVEKAEKIVVTLRNEDEYEAKTIGLDAKTDVALIKIEAKKDLPFLELGNSDKLRAGDFVVAIGNPFGYAHTVTSGIVSAKERTIGFGNYDQFIQTDASINPGNSGGPLLNIRGEVVGINAAIIATGQGIGFAIPINLAKNIIKQLKEKGKVVRGMIGVYIQKITPQLMSSLKLKNSQGALVSGLVKGAPAEKAGIKSGDVITKFNGLPINDHNELPIMVATSPINENAVVAVIRDGKEMEFRIKIEELKDDDAEQPTQQTDLSLGIKVQELTKELARSLGVADDVKGIVVTDVEESSTASRSGLKRGDIILEVNRKKIDDLNTYLSEIKKTKKGENILFLVQRDNGTIYIAFTVE